MIKDRKRLKWILLSIGLITLVFVVFIIKTGKVFPLHSYYIVPFVPVMAMVAGYFLSQIKARYAYILLAIVAIEAVANQQDDMFLKQSEKYKLSLEGITDKVIPENSLIVINGSPSPQHIYFAHRKGWTETSEVLKSGNFIDSVARLGADYLIWDKVKADPPKGVKNVVFEDTDYLIFNISKKKL